MPKLKKKTKSSNVLKFSFTETLTIILFSLISGWEYFKITKLSQNDKAFRSKLTRYRGNKRMKNDKWHLHNIFNKVQNIKKESNFLKKPKKDSNEYYVLKRV